MEVAGTRTGMKGGRDLDDEKGEQLDRGQSER